MEIRKLTQDDIPQLVEFNKKVFPNKHVDLEKCIHFWFSKNEKEYERTLILLNDDQQIVGQNFFSSMSYFLNGERYDSVWGFDLIIDEEYRKQNWGIDLLLACKKYEPASLATGSGPDALKMNLKLGQKLLGEIKKYVGIVNLLWSVTAIGRGVIPIDKFPLSINTKGVTYHRIGQDKLPDIDAPRNPQILEINRNRNFIKWRFFNDFHQYAFYLDDQCENWFVLRTTVIKHITVLMLVDWRCDASSNKEFENIFCACKKIANNLHIPVIITGSTLQVFDDVLEKHHFKSIGRPRPVIGRIKVKEYKEAIESRNFCFVTLADSDGETNML